MRPYPRRIVDFDWLAAASRLPGRSLNVAVAIWSVASSQRSPTISLAPYVLLRYGVSRDCCYDSLSRLSDEGLIAVSRCKGRLPRLTLLDAQARPLDIG